MLEISEIDLPRSVKASLRERAAFSPSLKSFTREHVAGFKQPVAATSALIFPVLVGTIYLFAGPVAAVEVAVFFAAMTATFLCAAWMTNRRWLQADFTRREDARRRAKTDLKCGRGVATYLRLDHPPLFFEHPHGVVALAGVEDHKTVFFDIDGDGSDPRWFHYLDGEMHRAEWRWLRLAGSGDVVDFAACGVRRSNGEPVPCVDAPAAWEAITMALGTPSDGDLIEMGIDEVEATIQRLL